MRTLLATTLSAALVAVMLAGCTTATSSVKTECPGDGIDSMVETEGMAAAPPVPASASMAGQAVGGVGQPAGQPLRLGVLVPLTGSLAAYGPSGEEAARLAAQHLNDAGGVNGQQVELFVADTRSSTAEAPTAFLDLVNDGVVATVGPYGSGTVGSILDLAVDNGVFVVTPSATSPALTADRDNEGWFARVPPSDSLQGQVLAQLVYAEGCRSASVMAMNNAYGTGLGGVFADTFEDLGGTVLRTVLFEEGGTTFSSQVQQAGRDDPDAIVFVGYPTEGVQVIRESYERGVMGDSVFFFSEGVRDEANFADVVGNKADGDNVLAGLKGTVPESTGGGTFFADAYQAEYGAASALFGDSVYDAVMALALAAAHAGENTGAGIKASFQTTYNKPGADYGPDEIAEALVAATAKQDINYVGVSNDFDLDEAGDPVEGVYSYWTVAADGTISNYEAGITV